MRSKKPELEDVVDQFEAWRAKPHGRRIPAELWKAALGLLDRYSPSTICGYLRLNAGRFKQMREARGVVEKKGRIGRRRSSASMRSPRKLLHRSSAREQVLGLGLAPGRNAFIELPPLSVGGASWLRGCAKRSEYPQVFASPWRAPSGRSASSR